MVTSFAETRTLLITRHSSDDEWYDSHVYQKTGDKTDPISHVNKEYRSSLSALIPSKDKVARCISRRMKKLLGNVQHEDTEPLQLVKYEGGEQFRLHQDWINPYKAATFNSKYPIRPYNRLLSSFVYLDGNCTGGETYFPDIIGVGPSADGEKYTRTDTGMGLLVRPKRGNAVFWKNMYDNGTGDPRVLHAGLPVQSGRKIGMNLFSLYYFDTPMLGETVSD